MKKIRCLKGKTGSSLAGDGIGGSPKTALQRLDAALQALQKPKRMDKTAKGKHNPSMDIQSMTLRGFNSFLKGVSSAFNLFGQVFIEIPDLRTGFERDREALAGDWQRIRNDMKNSVNQVIRER